MHRSTDYAPVTDRILHELRTVVGASHVIAGDSEALEAFSHDEIPDRTYAHEPEVVVNAATAEEVAAVLQLANREHIPVTPRGAGSGLSGGAVPVYGGIVLRTDRMNRILDVDLENMMVVVEPGVVTAAINENLRGSGLFYAGYPMSLETCFVGGNVAENAGGGKAVKYGVTGRYVLALQVVTPTGEIVRMGGKLIKDVSGYNLVQLMVGSEGTLGVITEITLRLSPEPKASADLLVTFPDTGTAITLVSRIMTETGITPTALEFIDRGSFAQTCRYLNESLPYEDAGAVLIITVDGPDREQVEREYETIGSLCSDHGAIEVYVADTRADSERVWRVRRNIAESYALISPDQANEDLVVPPARIPELIAGMEEIATRHKILIPAYGHAGDGNIHTRIVRDAAWTNEQWTERLPIILDELYTLTAELGGRISGEHGIGHKRKAHLPRFVAPEYVELMRTIKRAMDPNGILNPGKIFDPT
ncbi:MAG: FAD-linked oxidase C-terminal domain-containing protein [Alkalispirochaeta sp.]